MYLLTMLPKMSPHAGGKRTMNRCELQWVFLSCIECLIDVLRLQPLAIFVNN